MKTFQSKIDIGVNAKKVWDTMIHPDSYKEWVNVAWPGSYYEGNWGPGQNVKFISPGRGGTLVQIVEYRPYEYILAEHVAVINADGTEDRDSESAKNWIGTTESYTFHQVNGKTELETEMNTNPEWGQMFADSMPKALAKLKEICERK
ncbi:MAG: SRPBCC domain-containing protein [Bacteroidetes bacterium]|nr:MAG: SRPBCC domain-containing protein [Bacteroidota bacterium]